jgi:hypothetical protein
MKRFAELTTAGKESIEKRDWANFADLMRQNFENRKNIYGLDCIGKENMRMIEIGTSFGAACKFPGNLQLHALLSVT